MVDPSFSLFSNSVLSGGYGHLVRLAAATALVGLFLGLLSQLVRKPPRKLPPGPQGSPFIGNVRHAADYDWLSSPERKNEYGEMMYVSALGKGILVLNSRRVALDLLEKRSNIYSDRPNANAVIDHMTKGLLLGPMHYNDRLRRFRRASMDTFSKSGVSRFHPIQNREAMILALALMKNPSDREKHLRRHAFSIMLSINYHLPPLQSEIDPLVLEITDRTRRVSREVGARLIECFPWLRYVPSKFAKWKRGAQLWFNESSSLFECLMNKVSEDLSNGIDQAGFAAALIKNQEKYNFSERERAWLVGITVLAGGQGTTSMLDWWFLAMLTHPEVQMRAHSELDKVVGRARPPNFADLPSLPYVRAIIKETLRWTRGNPFALPHRSTADDWYEGMFIPKGTVCLPNMLVLNFDPDVFGEDAARFNPDRYFDENGVEKAAMDGREAGSFVFGFGRRLCVGRYVAEGTIAIDIATLLWATRFERLEGAQGELDAETIVLTGFSGRPVPFEFRVTPRFPEAESLTLDALELYQ